MVRKVPPKPFESGLKALDDNGEPSTEGLTRDYVDNGKKEKSFIVLPTPANAFILSLGGLLVLSVVYGPLIWQARRAMYQHHVALVPDSAPLDRFSSERAMKHIYTLAGKISGRQEATAGLENAFSYLKSELQNLQKRASSDLVTEIDDSLVNGSFNIMFLGHAISNTYRNHRNIAFRIAGKDSKEGEAAVLVNGHLDSPLGSPGAADCASCVATILEVLRYIVDANWVPPAPIVFLFNGAEEVFLLGSHGFMTTHKWKDSLGAVINIEASGASGPDLVVQSGPGTWPARVYAESAVHPMANTAAQDVFPLIPGDTDYRIIARDFGDVPGVDIVLLLDGYVYHTAYDIPERVSQRSMQARGENLIGLLRGFTTAPELQNSSERALQRMSAEKRPIFFDLYGLWMISYSQKVARALHLLPMAVVFLIPSISSVKEGAHVTLNARIKGIVGGALLQACGCFLAVVFPVLLALLRLTVSKTAMTWFAHPWISYFMFCPVSVAGLLIPREIVYGGREFRTEQQQKELDWSSHWGGVALNAFIGAMFILLGISSGYMCFYWALFMLPALSILQAFQNRFGNDSFLALAGYILPALLPAAYMCYYTGITLQFITEKLGMSGTFPDSISFFIADMVLAIIFGIFVSLTVGPLLPVLSKWIGRPPAIRFLFYVSICAAVTSSLLFPYSSDAPKRVILAHTFKTNGPNEVVESSYNFATIDPNPMKFVWKHSPEVVHALHIDARDDVRTVSNPTAFLALYPISRLFTLSAEIPIDIIERISRPSTPLPHLQIIEPYQEELSNDINHSLRRRIHLELNLGALPHVWSTVMNITGPLSSWSFADLELPQPERVGGGPPSYICRLSGKEAKNTWRFWIEAESSQKIRVELAVLDQATDVETQKLVGLFHSWVAIVAGTTYTSTYFV